jgi:mRNA-degrading endonuclease toxin of MazEF toxin-antitoxin module
LRDGAAVLTTHGTEFRVPFRVTADPGGLTPDDLPIATGPQPPSARGSAPLVLGLRDPARTLDFARSAGLLSELGLLDQLPGFLKPDLGDLGPNGTVTSATLDLTRLTARTEPPDPGDWATKLGRIDTLAGLAGRAVLGDVDIDQRDGAYTVTQGGQLVARAGVYGPVLVLSNDPAANLRAAAVAPASPRPPGAAGALTVRLRSSLLATQIPELIRARIGDLTAWARAELTGVTGELRLALR